MQRKKGAPGSISRRPPLFLNLSPLSYINPAIDFWAKERTFEGKIPM